MSNYKIGEIYYQNHNLLYRKDPYYWAWKCIAKKENGEPVFERISPPDYDHFIFTLSQFGFGHELYSKEEVDKEVENDRKRVKEMFTTKEGIISFVVNELASFVKYDEYGNTLTKEEREQLTKRLKEEFGLDIHMDGDDE